MNESVHLAVLAAETIAALAVKEDGVYVDATFGRGGHSAEILARLGPGGRLLALDRDPEAVAAGRERFISDRRFEIVHQRFSRLASELDRRRLMRQIDGIVFDLGVSSPQLDEAARGFSFKAEGPLDMRMDPTSGESAAAWLARAGEEEIARVLRDYGEERFARRIARAIIAARAERPIATTGELAAIVRSAVPTREPGKDAATRTFQAIRIHVNRELDELEQALPQALDALASGGRLAVISFHSLEDRLVKRFIRRESKGAPLPPELPVPAAALRLKLRSLGKPVFPTEVEAAANPRARSAVLRVAERIEEPGE